MKTIPTSRLSLLTLATLAALPLACSKGGSKAPLADSSVILTLAPPINKDRAVTLSALDGKVIADLPPGALPEAATTLGVRLYADEQILIAELGGGTAITAPVSAGGLGSSARFLGAVDLSLRDSTGNGLNFAEPISLELELDPRTWQGGEVLIAQGFDPSTTFAGQDPAMFTRFVANAPVVERVDPDSGRSRFYVQVRPTGANVPITQAYGSPPICCYQVDPGAPVEGNVNRPTECSASSAQRDLENLTKYENRLRQAVDDARTHLATAKGQLEVIAELEPGLFEKANRGKGIIAAILTSNAWIRAAEIAAWFTEWFRESNRTNAAFERVEDSLTSARDALQRAEDHRAAMRIYHDGVRQLSPSCVSSVLTNMVNQADIWMNEIRTEMSLFDATTWTEVRTRIQGLQATVEAMQEAYNRRNAVEMDQLLDSATAQLRATSPFDGAPGLFDLLELTEPALFGIRATLSNLRNTLVEAIQATTPAQEGLLVRYADQSYFSAFTDRNGSFILPPRREGWPYEIVVVDPWTQREAARFNGVGVASTASSPHHQVSAQGSQIPPGGQEFLMAFQNNLTPGRSLRMNIGSATGSTGLIEIPRQQLSLPFSVPAESCAEVVLPWQMVNAAIPFSNAVANNGIRIRSSAPVECYGFNSAQYSTDAMSIASVESLGQRFRACGYTVSVVGDQFQATVVAMQDGTQVQITPQASEGSLQAGVPFTVTLDAYQSYTFRSQVDQTGSLIVTSLPVAVFSGNLCANVPSGFQYCDHLVEQMADTADWGREHVVIPFHGRQGGDVVRVLADRDNTSVVVTDAVTTRNFTLMAGAFTEFMATTNTHILTNHPVAVFQYATGGEFDNQVADPFMLTSVPSESWLQRYSLVVGNNQFPNNHANIVARAVDVRSGSVRLNGTSIAQSEFSPVVGTTLMAARVALPAGCHTLSSAGPLQASVYGFALWDSFGYSGGRSYRR